jgi:hypothetical protein
VLTLLKSAQRLNEAAPTATRAHRQSRAISGYLLTTATAGARPGSVEVLGGTFSLRLPADSWCGSLMACVLAGHRGAEWLKRGLPCSK